MINQMPTQPKIYHILHVDRLASVISEGCLWCDAETVRKGIGGTTIGMSRIKERRLHSPLNSHDGLMVGDCVPFYFCPRSIMLYMIHKGNHRDMQYRGGQNLIVHLEADLGTIVRWAGDNNRRWAFTTSNAGSEYFDDYASLDDLNKIDWQAVQATSWTDHKEGKQAEFLLESSMPWELVERVVVHNHAALLIVNAAIANAAQQPVVTVDPAWYY